MLIYCQWDLKYGYQRKIKGLSIIPFFTVIEFRLLPSWSDGFLRILDRNNCSTELHTLGMRTPETPTERAVDQIRHSGEAIRARWQ